MRLSATDARVPTKLSEQGWIVTKTELGGRSRTAGILPLIEGNDKINGVVALRINNGKQFKATVDLLC